MIKQNKLSLTKKLDGGYLHVKKSPNKPKMNKGGYIEYLNKIKNGGCTKPVNKLETSKGGGNRKVVSVKLKSPKKRVSAKKQGVKDIPNIIPRKKSNNNRVKKEPVKKEPVKKEPVIVPAPAPEPANLSNKKPQKPNKQTGVKIQGPKTNASLKKQRVLKRSSGKSRGRRLNKSLTKRRGGSHHKRGKRISVTKTRKFTDKDVTKIRSKLNEIKKKSDKEIKQELEKQGVKLSGKSPSIMKDVYMYSQLCGINIKRE